MPAPKPTAPSRPHYRLVETQAGRRVVAAAIAEAQAPSRWSAYARLMRLDKPIGILLLLWPTLWALVIASHGEPDPYHLFAFMAGTVLMRSAGCAINDWADRDYDRHVERTRDRPLTAGLIRSWEAMAVFIVLSLVALLLILILGAGGVAVWDAQHDADEATRQTVIALTEAVAKMDSTAVAITSPGASAVQREMYSMIAGTSLGVTMPCPVSISAGASPAFFHR